jgi:two-component system LytT family sensor kinase
MGDDLSYVLLDAVAFVAGAALSAMLGLMQWRVDRDARRVSGYLLLWFLGFVWTFGTFLRCALNLAGAGPDSAEARFAEGLAWSSTLLGPITIGRLLQGAIGIGSRAARIFWAFAIPMSCANLGLFLYATTRFDGSLDASDYPATSFYVGLAVTAIALVLYAHERRGAGAHGHTTPRERWFVPAALLFATIQAAAILLGILFPAMPSGLLTITTLVGRHWTIPWSVLIAVSLAQAHYADVVLKRSLWLLASVALAAFVGMQADETPGLRQLAITLAMAAALLSAPLLFRVLGQFVDRAILKRPDYSHRFLADTHRPTEEPDQVVDAAMACLRETLRVDARWIAGASGAATPPALASVDVQCPDGRSHRIEITASHQARTVTPPERAFLDSVGRHLEHRLDALHLETEQRALHLREERLKRLLTEAELKALRTQVDPHFLFNTLNTIAELIGTNPKQAERMTERLAECFRYALAKHSRALSTLDEELDFARHYLEIEQVRFGDRLRVSLSRGDAVGTEQIPSLLLQPLIENAIRHGLAPVREGGCVKVEARRDGTHLRLTVEDDGVGLRSGSSAGVGLRNVKERLRTMYAEAAQLIIQARAEGRGTEVTILVPLHAH